MEKVFFLGQADKNMMDNGKMVRRMGGANSQMQMGGSGKANGRMGRGLTVNLKMFRKTMVATVTTIVLTCAFLRRREDSLVGRRSAAEELFWHISGSRVSPNTDNDAY